MVHGNYKSIYKKGDKLECSNYRAITLLNVTYKVLSGILYNRLTVYAEEILGNISVDFVQTVQPLTTSLL